MTTRETQRQTQIPFRSTLLRANDGKRKPRRWSGLVLFVVALTCAPCIHAQGQPTATQRLHASAFAGITGTYTGLASGRNLGITAGVDLGFGSFFSLQPSVELRGTYPLDKGSADSQKNILGGVKLLKDYRRFQPYGDVLFGRGQINYINGFRNPAGDFIYFQTYSNILSLGGGLDVPFSEHLRLKADGQFQRYSTPVTDSGQLYAKAFTLGIIYRFGSNHVMVR